jgi:hypothetical protein
MRWVGQELVEIRHRYSQRELHVSVGLMAGAFGRDVNGEVRLCSKNGALLQKALHGFGEAQSHGRGLRHHNSSCCGIKSRPTDL